MATTSFLPPGLAAPIPFCVTPYYNSEGPAINVGTLSKALALATPATIGVLVEAWRRRTAVATLSRVTFELLGCCASWLTSSGCSQ